MDTSLRREKTTKMDQSTGVVKIYSGEFIRRPPTQHMVDGHVKHTIPFSITQGFTTYSINQTGMTFHIVQGIREMAMLLP